MHKQKNLYHFSHDEEESVLLTLVELLTSACEQEMSGDALGANTVSSQFLYQNTIRKYLQRLAHGLDPDVRESVAAHPYTPIEVLHRLSQDEDPLVRKAVAEQKWLPEEILRMLAQDNDPTVRLTVAKQGQVPGEVLYALAQDEDVKVRLAVSRRPDIPMDALHILARNEDVWDRCMAATHAQIPVEVLCTLAQDEDASVRDCVAANPRTPVVVLHQLCRDPNEWVRCAVAHNPQTPVDILCGLAQDEHEPTRSKVAEHPHTPVEILCLLAQDKEMNVRRSVAENPRTSIEALHMLSLNESRNVRWAVASHSHASEEILRALAQDKDMSVRCSVATNPQTPGEVLYQHCLDPREWVRRAVASHPQMPEEGLLTLARNVPQNTHVHHNVGLAVAMHSQASAEILHLLTHYPNEQVQWLARFVQKLVAEYGDTAREQVWWAKLRWFFDEPGCAWIGIRSIETQLDKILALDIPEHLRQMIITALAADWVVWDVKHTFAVTDERDAATLLRARLTFYRHLMAPLLPPVVLQKLAESPHWEVRYLMALHKHTPWETRQILSQDENRYVRTMARMKAAQMKEQRVN